MYIERDVLLYYNMYVTEDMLCNMGKQKKLWRDCIMIRKKLVTCTLAVCLAASTLACGVFTSHAAETADETYTFDNRNNSGYTRWRPKTNDTKVYVYPKSGPALYYTVWGKNAKDNETNRSYRFYIPSGTQASITNYVYERGDIKACIKYDRKSYAYEYTRGVWSPDSTRNYIIY